MNAVQEEVANWIAMLKQSGEELGEQDRDMIKAIVSDLIQCRAKDVEDFIAKTYKQAN